MELFQQTADYMSLPLTLSYEILLVKKERQGAAHSVWG